MSSFCKCKSCSHFLSKNVSVYTIFNDQSFNDRLTNDIASFEQLGPECHMLTVTDYCLSQYLSLHQKHFVKGYGLVQCYFPWTAQHYYKQALAFTKKLDLRLAHIVCWVLTKLFVKANTSRSITKIIHLFKYIENLKPKKENCQIKNSDTFHIYIYFCSKHRLWVLVRTASARQF